MNTESMYTALGITPAVHRFGEEVLAGLRARFDEIDRVAEYNQCKVIGAMQKNRVDATHFAATTGYGYNDAGRDNLERVYADCFHTEAALVRPQITCGTHALTVALSANLLPGDTLLSPVGAPYDTLEEVIGIRPSACSLKEYGVHYRQVDLPVVHAVFLERAGARADADDLLERVIRRADGAEQRVAGQEVGAERHGQRVRAAGDLGAHERGFRVEAVGIDALEIVAPGVVVAVARGGGKVRRVDTVFLHRADDLALVIFRDAVDLVEARAQTGEHLLAEAVHRRRDAERGVHGLCIHRSSPYIIRHIIGQIRRKFLRPRRA